MYMHLGLKLWMHRMILMVQGLVFPILFLKNSITCYIVVASKSHYFKILFQIISNYLREELDRHQ